MFLDGVADLFGHLPTRALGLDDQDHSVQPTGQRQAVRRDRRRRRVDQGQVEAAFEAREKRADSRQVRHPGVRYFLDRDLAGVESLGADAVNGSFERRAVANAFFPAVLWRDAIVRQVGRFGLIGIEEQNRFTQARGADLAELAGQFRGAFAAFNILVPYPNTPLYRRLESEGVHMDSYTMVDVAEDMDAARRALGYDRIDY